MSCPHRTLDGYGGCGLCRALTPPKHHRGAREGSGPGAGSSWWRDRETRSSGEEDGRERRDRRVGRTEKRDEENRTRSERGGRDGAAAGGVAASGERVVLR